jgi:hypothetical protein
MQECMNELLEKHPSVKQAGALFLSSVVDLASRDLALDVVC